MARNRFRKTLRPAAALCSLLLIAVAVPAAASAESSGFEELETSLSFPKETAQVVGSHAIVFVVCEGSEAGSCEGTLVLKMGTHKHKVPYMVIGGAGENIAVPLGPGESVTARRGVAIARTTQLTGGCVRTREVLRFK